MSNSVWFIDTASELSKFCKQVSNTDIIAVDTEFIREKNYYPKLCLIQVATEDVTACIDPIALDDLSELKDILVDSTKTKVFHAARQDLELFYHVWGIIPCPIYDTQLAVTLLGLGDQVGYAALVKHFLNKTLPKIHTRSDWQQRPLEDDQLQYAADDVHFLIQIYPMIQAELEKRGRSNWLDEDMQTLCNTSLYTIEPLDMWQRISGRQKLRGQALAVLQQLAAWRETQAQQRDLPRKWIMSDQLLITLALQQPQSADKIFKHRDIPRNMKKLDAEKIIDIITKAKQIPKESWPSLSKPDFLDTEQSLIADTLMLLIKQIAQNNELTPNALATRKDVEKLIKGDPDSVLLHGWKNKLIGKPLTQFLSGQVHLFVKQNRLVTEPVKDNAK